MDFNKLECVYEEGLKALEQKPGWWAVYEAVKKAGHETPLIFTSDGKVLKAFALVSAGPLVATRYGEVAEVLEGLMRKRPAFSLTVTASEAEGLLVAALRLMREIRKVFRVGMRPGVRCDPTEAGLTEVDLSFREMRPSEKGMWRDIEIDPFAGRAGLTGIGTAGRRNGTAERK